MLKILKTDAKNPSFVLLVKQLDAYLKITDGNEHAYYNQYNSIDNLKHVIVLFDNEVPVACGAFKQFDSTTVEIKRMFVTPKYRKHGLGKNVVMALEDWAKDLGYNYAILETGKRQVEAVAFYKTCNYYQIPKYGQYKIMGTSKNSLI